jgi:hypothetical protein
MTRPRKFAQELQKQCVANLSTARTSLSKGNLFATCYDICRFELMGIGYNYNLYSAHYVRKLSTSRLARTRIASGTHSKMEGMKIKRRTVITIVLILLVRVIAASFIGMFGYSRMQARNAQLEFSRDHPVQPSAQGNDPRPTPKPGIASNPMMQMIHDMAGIPMPGQ